MKFDILLEARRCIAAAVISGVMPCSLVDRYLFFEGTCYVHLHSLTSKKEASDSGKNFCTSPPNYMGQIPEDEITPWR
jgi:hypothetical protein